MLRALRKQIFLGGVLMIGLPDPSRAQAVLSAQLAQRIIEGCVAHAKAKRQSHAVAVYDPSASPVAVLRMDGNPPGVVEFAMQKALAVAKWHFSTADMARAARDTPGFATAPHVVTLAGGVPILSADGKTFLGSVGVSGEAAQDDVACAEAGILAADLRSK